MLFIALQNIDIHNLIVEGIPCNKFIELEKYGGSSIDSMLDAIVSTKESDPLRVRWSYYDSVIKELTMIVLGLLKNGRRSYNRYKKSSLKNQHIFIILRNMGYNISRNKTNELARDCRRILKDSYLHINHLPGDKVEFDWGSIELHIGDKKKTTRVYLAVFSFPYSNYKKIYVMEKSDGKSFVSALNQFVSDMDGVPPLFVLDNMKIARKFSSKIDSNVRLTSLFDDLCKHFKFDVRFCSPYCPHEKGNVENNVGVIKQQFQSSYVNLFNNIEEVQEFVDQKVDELNTRKHPFKNDTCENLINHERNTFEKVPETPYVYYNEKTSKVYNNGLFLLNGNYYSVPEVFKDGEVFVKYNDKKIIIHTLDKKEVIATYTPSKGKGKRNFNVWHMLYKLIRKSNAFQNSLEYRSMPKHLKLILDKIFNNDSRSFLEFLSKIENKGKRKLRRFVYKNQFNLDKFSERHLIEMLC